MPCRKEKTLFRECGSEDAGKVCFGRIGVGMDEIHTLCRQAEAVCGIEQCRLTGIGFQKRQGMLRGALAVQMA